MFITTINKFVAKATINPITEKLKIALKNSLFADFTFKFSESLHIFKVHRFILVAKCEYFAEMFRGMHLFSLLS